MNFPTQQPKNPLSIISLLIFLVYAISAALLGTSVRTLSSYNQPVIVGFIVLFPIMVSLGFAYLIIKHHTKLYAPGDYRSDEAFLTGIQQAPSKQLGESAAGPTDASGATNDASSNLDQPSDATPSPDELGSSAARSQERSERRRRAFLAETLAFQQLQEKLGGSVRRNVAVGADKIRLDGIIETKNEIIAVEVNYTAQIRDPKAYRVSLRQLDRAINAARSSGVDITRGILVLVDDADSNVQDRFDLPKLPNVEFQVMNFADLFTKYGLS